MKRFISQQGFTLIEGIIAIVIMGIAMVTLTSFLFPQAERSAIPHYQARAAAIGHAMLNEILARKFDENSDPFGDSTIRCGETDAEGNHYACTPPPLTAGTGSFDLALADSVDDFIGCWGEQSLCENGWRGELTEIIAGDDYANIWVEVGVAYDDLSGNGSSVVTDHKRVSVEVKTTRYGDYEFVAYRSNY